MSRVHFRMSGSYIILILAFIFFLPFSAVYAQNQFFTYDLNLSPGLDGSLNARINMGLQWNTWLSSHISAYSDNYFEVQSSEDQKTTIVSRGQNLDLTILRVDQNLFWMLIGERLNFLRFSAGAVLAYSYAEQEQYGYDLTKDPFEFYINESARTVFRPLQSYSLSVVFGPLQLSGRFESTVYWSTEQLTTSKYVSTTNEASEPEETILSGGDTNVYGDIELDLQFIRLLGGYSFSRHVLTDGTSQNSSASDTHAIHAGIILSFVRIPGGSPMLGASVIYRDDFLVSTTENLISQSIRLNFGLRY